MSIDRSSGTGLARPWLVAGLLFIVAGAAIAALLLRRVPVTPPAPLTLSLRPPDELIVGGGDYPFGLALAPDGRRVAMSALRGDVTQLWLRDLARDDVQPLPGTEGAVLPFWAPDGQSLGFFAADRLRMFVFADGSVRDLAAAPVPRGGAWHPNGDIFFTPHAEGPMMRRRTDGTIEPFTTVDSGEISHRHPMLLQGGGHVVFFVRASEPPREGIWIAPVDDPAQRRRLTRSDAHAIVIADALIYSSEGALVLQRVDAEARALQGAAVLVGTPVGRGPQDQLFATVGGNVLIYGVPTSGLRELRWVDRSGASVGAVGEPMIAREVRVSADGDTVAVSRVDPQLNTFDIWTYRSTRPLPLRISGAIDVDDSPAWSNDGLHLAWVTARRTIAVRNVAGEANERPIRKFDAPVAVSDWSDPRWIIYSETRPETRSSDIGLVPPTEGGEPRAYARSPFNEVFGAVSPDGRWMAYASDESGRFDIYVDSFPAPGRRARLTVGGGTEPRWAQDGSQVFFRRGTEIHVVRLAAPAEGPPEALDSERLFDARVDIRSFDIAPDGSRVLLNVPAPDSEARPMTVVVNVHALVPTLERVRR